MAKLIKKLLFSCFFVSLMFVITSCTNTGTTNKEPHQHVNCFECGLCIDKECDGTEEEKCTCQELPSHEHVACDICGKCTAADCDGNADIKCEGHSVNPDSSIKDGYDCITIVQAIELAKEAGTTGTADKYYVYGIVKKVSNSVYGEMTIEDETGELYVYGVYSSDGSTRYDAMEERPVAGDEVVLCGILKTYNDSPEMDRGYLQIFKHNEVQIDDSNYTEYTVDAARELEATEKVKLTGVVAQITYAFGQVPNGFYLVDNTGSIYVYGSETAGQVKVGNTVTIIGEKTYYVAEKEQSAAEKHGYKGCCQIQSPQLIENDKGNSQFDKSWIEETTVKQIIETEVTENITTNIFKVNSLIKKVEGTGFTNYYFNDIDGYTGSYAYTACSGADFAWLDEFDGKICTVYLSPINCKSTNAGCIYRFVPVLVVDEGYKFDESNAPDYAIEYHAMSQFLSNYESDPATELITTVDSELLGFSGVLLTYTSSNDNVVYFEEVDDKVVFHTKDSGTAVVTITASYTGEGTTGDYSKSIKVEINVTVPVEYENITVQEAIDSADGTEVILRGIVVSSLVNQYGFYLQDETGIIAVCGNEADIKLLSSGDEVVIKGTKSHKVKDGYTGKGQINVYNAEILVNYYGDNEYSTDKFITGETVEYLYGLDVNEDHSTEVYILEGIIEVVIDGYFTSIKLTSLDGKTKLSLYSSSANQYSFLKPFDGQTVTVEIAPCNWNSKTYYAACVLAVYSGETKVINTLNFNE